MKKVLLISLLVIMVFVVGCTQKVNEETAGMDDKSAMETPENEADTIDSAGDSAEMEEEAAPVADSADLALDDSADDCSILTAKDIQDVCGVSTVAEEQVADINKGQVCVTLFKTDDPMKALKIHYTGDNTKGTLTPEALAQGSCSGMKAEMITDYSCYAESAGKTVFVYGKKRIVGIANSLPMDDYFICSRDQLKELGQLVSDRIHN